MHHLPDGGLSTATLDEQILQPGTKGLPICEPLRQGAIGVQRWNVLRADTAFPVAILKLAALQHNLDWMRQFCARFGVLLAPHGKTTMSPQLFGAQLANGAWGMTLASANQMQVAHRFGVRRVLLANELVAPADVRIVLHLLQHDPDFECYVLVDSEAGVARLAQAVRAQPLKRPLPVLVELGMDGKRCGVRSPQQALALARSVAATPGLQLAGVEGYEGLVAADAVGDFMCQLGSVLAQADAEGLFEAEQIVLTAGGSAYFDLVARGFAAIGKLSRPLLPVLRSGCYLSNDHGHYQNAIADLCAREPQAPAGGLHSALEVWSVVLSRPEPDLAILSMGKRDASYDMALPTPLLWHRPGPGAPTALPVDCQITKMNDQHAYLRLAPGSELAVGDLVGCGISHPCTTFDKWPLLLLVDQDYNVQSAINTFF